MLNLFNKDIAVLDITSHLISCIVGVKKSQSVFTVKASCEQQHQGYENGQWFDKDDTASVIKDVLAKAVKASSTRTKRLFVSVPGEFASVLTRGVSVKLDKKRQIVDDDIDYLFKKGDDFSKEKYVLIGTSPIYFAIDNKDALYDDVRGLEANNIEACISYMLAEKEYVDFVDAIAAEFGFTDVRYVLTEWAEVMGLLDSDRRNDVFMLVDVGYMSSSISIAKGNGIIDMRSFSMGGGHIAGDIYEYLEVPFEMAENAKRLVDLNLHYADGEILVGDSEYTVYASHAKEIVKLRLDMLADIIKGVLSEVEDAPPHYLPVFLTGEGVAPIRGAKKYLSDCLIRHVEILASNLPNYFKPEDSSKACLIKMADSIVNNSGIGNYIKRLFNGGKNK